MKNILCDVCSKVTKNINNVTVGYIASNEPETEAKFDICDHCLNQEQITKLAAKLLTKIREKVGQSCTFTSLAVNQPYLIQEVK